MRPRSKHCWCWILHFFQVCSKPWSGNKALEERLGLLEKRGRKPLKFFPKRAFGAETVKTAEMIIYIGVPELFELFPSSSSDGSTGNRSSCFKKIRHCRGVTQGSSEVITMGGGLGWARSNSQKTVHSVCDGSGRVEVIERMMKEFVTQRVDCWA